MQFFGTPHLATLGCILLLSLFYIYVGRRQRHSTLERFCILALAGAMLVSELLIFGHSLYMGEWSYEWGLPIQLCDVAYFSVLGALFLETPLLLTELAYFLSIGGSTQALLTPDMPRAFPDPYFIAFFISHGAVVVGALYLTAGIGRRLTKKSILRVWLFVNAYTLLIGTFNWLTSTNYMYLCYKPEKGSLLDLFGPWPWYIAAAQILLLMVLCVCYGLYCLIRPSTPN